MKPPRFTLVFAILFSMTLAAGGCSDSADDTEVDAGPRPADQCTNASDLAIANGLVDAPDGGFPDAGRMDGLVSDEAFALFTAPLEECSRTDCQTEIFQQSPTIGICLETCASENGLAGTSAGCMNCWAELVDCAIHLCTTQCIGGNMDLCDDCLELQCLERFHDCTGFDAPVDAP